MPGFRGRHVGGRDLKEFTMLWRTLAVAATCLILGVTGAAQENTSKMDAQRVQGTWDWDPAAKQSDIEPVVLLERIVIKGDTLTFHYSMGGKKFTAPTEFKLDPTKSPKTIDFTPTDKDNPAKGLVQGERI
jgi:uncharacterized protein (TIGR03067 family)